MSRNNYLALVGMHGPPERTGLELLASHRHDAVPGWDVEPGNELAIAAGVRFVEVDASWQYPGDPNNPVYERRRPSELLPLSWRYKKTIEVHDRPDATGDYAVVGGAWRHDLLAIAASLGIRSVIIEDGTPTLANYANNIVVDLCRADGPDSEEQIAKNVLRLRNCMNAVTTDTLPPLDIANFDFYNFVSDIHGTIAARLNLDDAGTVQPFEPLPDRVVQLLNLNPDDSYVAQCWNGINSSGGVYYGTVLKRTTVPPPISSPITSRASGSDIQPQAHR